MIDVLADGPLPELQREIRARCRHRSGTWEAFDWARAEQSLPARFGEVTARHPERIAVLEPGGSMTYAALDRAANRVASAIVDRLGPGPGAVAILGDLDAGTLAAVLGVLKAGALFVAPDASLPAWERQRVLDDAGANLVLAGPAHLEAARQLAGPRRLVLSLESLSRRGDADNPRVTILPDAPATIVYTSGSTGTPRGVLHTHRTLLVEGGLTANSLRLSDADRVACVSSLSWLATVWTLLGPLLVGSCTCPFDVRIHGIERLGAWARTAGITVCSTRVVVRQMLAVDGAPALPEVRACMIGGDTIYRQDIEGCRRLFPNALVVTGLASSEAGRATYLFLDGPAAARVEAVVPLGYAVPGKRIRILDKDGRAAPMGEPGEIVVEGRYLAAGYWRRPELTAARFRPGGTGSERGVRTGDVGRMHPDGCVMHLGRVDTQVKVRGYQVPLAEVEAALLDVRGVREAVAVPHGAGPEERRIAAYVVPETGASLGPQGLRRALEAVLPPHMVPRSFSLLERLPRTASGKVDRSALLPPPGSRPDLETPHAVPRNPAETRLAEIWAVSLGLDTVGIHDPFLDLGGDSLAAMRIAARVAEAGWPSVTMTDLLSAVTVAEMATLLEEPPRASRSG